MKIELKGIKNIIFDLGGVVLDLDANASVKAFQEFGLKYDMLDEKLNFSDPLFYEIQTGEITPFVFRNKVREILRKPKLSDKQIDDAWCAMLAGIPISRIELINKLKNHYNVMLFSNTNKIHIDKLEKEFFGKNGFSLSSVFSKIFYSYQIKDAKPAVSSFQKVINLSGINPSESIFIDDAEENILGAKRAGLKTFWLKKGMELDDVFII